jgi:glycosyltransferase involved in cell wall biosynthesis
LHHREARITAAERNARPFLSVVIPAFNEERRLPPTLTRLHDYLHDRPYDWEVIVVSNGCTDATDEVVREAAKQIPNLHLIALAERGKGIATKTGALRSSGEIVFLCDADLSMPPENISAFLDRLETAEVIVGSREAPGSHRYGEPWHRHMMGRVFNSLVQFVAVRGIEDTQCGFKAFRRNAARDLFSRQTLIGFGFDVELLYLARKLGYRIQELGIPWYFDNDTRVRPGMDSVGMFYEVLMVRLRDAAGRYGRLAPAPEVEGDVV